MRNAGPIQHRNQLIVDLRAENEKLREALREIRNELGVPNEDYPAPVAHAVEIARAALSDEEWVSAAAYDRVVEERDDATVQWERWAAQAEVAHEALRELDTLLSDHRRFKIGTARAVVKIALQDVSEMSNIPAQTADKSGEQDD